VQSSTKITNQRCPEAVVIGEGPHTSECINANGIVLLFMLTGYETL